MQHDVIGLAARTRDVLRFIQRQLAQSLLHCFHGHFHRQELTYFLFIQEKDSHDSFLCHRTVSGLVGPMGLMTKKFREPIDALVDLVAAGGE